MSMTLIEYAMTRGSSLATGTRCLFLAQNQDACWVAVQGGAELFHQGFANAPLGARRMHLTSLEQGETLFSLPGRGKTRSLMAEPAQGATLCRVSLHELADALARGEVFLPDAASALESFAQRVLSRDRLAPTVRPDEDQALDATGLELATGESYGPEHTLAWIKLESGRAHLFPGVEAAAGEVLPVPSGLRVTAAEPCRAFVFSSAKALADLGLASCLEAISLALFPLLEADAAAFAERLEQDARCLEEEERASQAGSLVRLATASGAGCPEQPLLEAESPLLTACRLVARAQGLVLAVPRDLPYPDVESVAAASGTQIRQVRLEPGWQRDDCGPLLGFLEQDGSPVALLPDGPSAYTLVRHSSGERLPVTRETAKNLKPYGYMFYRRLPSKSLRIRDLISFGLAGRKRDFAWIIGLGAALGLIGLVTPLVSQVIFSDVIPESDKSRLFEFVCLLLGFAGSSTLLEIGKNFARIRIESGADHDMEAAVLDRLVRLPVGFFRRFNTGDLTQRALGINTLRMTVSEATISGFISSSFALIYLALLFWYNARLAWLALALLIVLAGVSLAVNLSQLRFQRPMFDLAGKLSGVTLQLITAVTKLKVSRAERRAFSLWADKYSQQTALTRKASLLGIGLNAFNSVFELLGPMVIFVGIIWLTKQDSHEVGAFIGFWSAFGSLQAALLDLVGALTQVVAVSPLIGRMRPILETQPETHEAKADPGEITGRVEFSAVSFRYRDDLPLVLKDVSIRAEAGKMVAIVGPSGSGKSTLIRLLLCFETPEKGTISVDDQDIRNLDPIKLRRHMGVVLQNSGVLAGSLFENIAGARNVSLDEAWKAARLAGLEESIKQMPMGMHTYLMEGGRTLSGGQRQRLLIARALATKPRIIVFDEATSALDNRTQEIVAKSLESLQGTRIVVAHRLSTIAGADHIYVIDKGAVREQGDYATLMAQKGLFHQLAMRQTL